jgi:hypothetical protein
MPRPSVEAVKRAQSYPLWIRIRPAVALAETSGFCDQAIRARQVWPLNSNLPRSMTRSASAWLGGGRSIRLGTFPYSTLSYFLMVAWQWT